MSQQTPSGPGERNAGLDIWVLEDDPIDQRLITTALDRIEATSPPVMARTAEELLARLEGIDQLPDLFLVDLNTPGAGGVSLARQLRSRNELVTVPIVVLTSSVNARDHAEASRAGVNAFHVKPFDWRHFNELIAMVVAYWSLNGTNTGLST